MDYAVGGVLYVVLVAAVTYGGIAGGGTPALDAPASLVMRWAARMIDFLLFTLPLFAWVLGTMITDGAEAGDRTDAIFGRFSPATLALTAALFILEAGFVAIAGGTPGKLILGLRVVDPATGRWPSPVRAALRTGALSAAGMVPLGVIAVGAPAVRDHMRRGLHDRLTRTVVVRLTSPAAQPGSLGTTSHQSEARMAAEASHLDTPSLEDINARMGAIDRRRRPGD